MKMMKELYLNNKLYLNCDVLLCAGEFEQFRNRFLENYGLYLSNYLVASSPSLDAVLNMTIVELKRISDVDMYLFLEKGMKGDVS